MRVRNHEDMCADGFVCLVATVFGETSRATSSSLAVLCLISSGTFVEVLFCVILDLAVEVIRSVLWLIFWDSFAHVEFLMRAVISGSPNDQTFLVSRPLLPQVHPGQGEAFVAA